MLLASCPSSFARAPVRGLKHKIPRFGNAVLSFAIVRDYEVSHF